MAINIADFTVAHRHISEIMPVLRHPAAGKLPHPYLSVGFGRAYAGAVFAWDNHHMTLRFAADGDYGVMRDFLATLLDFQRDDGFVPSLVFERGGASGIDPEFHAQPFLAQNAAVFLRESGDCEYIETIFDKLVRYLEYWFANHSTPLGLCRWKGNYLSGFDNEIAGAIFFPHSLVKPDLNSWLYLELKAMGYIAGKLNRSDDFSARAEELKMLINRYLWSDASGVYGVYDLDIGAVRCGINNQAGHTGIGAYSFIGCPALIPLFAGIAPRDRAESMIDRYVLSREHFRSHYGIRSLSRSSEYYNNARWGNPNRFDKYERLTNSNWQGPVWIPLNWFAFHALLRYDRREAAEALANDTFKVIRMSVESLGFMRENFDGETGEPLYADKFASWNILADLMVRYLEPDKYPAPLKLFFD